MINAFAAGAIGLAVAASAVVVPVTEIGEQGWREGGATESYTTTFTPTTVELTAEAGARVEMELTKLIGLYSLTDLVDEDGNLALALEGEDAVVKFPSALIRDGWNVRGTSIVFHPAGSTDAPGEAQVQLTYYSDPDVWMTVDEFVSDVQDGTLKGTFQGAVTVGYTNTAEQGGWTAAIDTFTFDGVTYDFGTGVEEGPGKPGNPNPGKPEDGEKPGNPNPGKPEDKPGKPQG